MNNQKNISIAPTFYFFVLIMVACLLLIGGAVCSDGWKSGSIGSSGACSHHGGVRTWPGWVALIFSLFVSFKFHELRTYLAFRKAGKDNDEISHANTSKVVAEDFINDQTSQEVSTSIVMVAAPLQKRDSKRLPKDSLSSCPKCRSIMVLRIAKKGRSTGNKFWGCSKYPRCKGVRPYDGKAEEK